MELVWPSTRHLPGYVQALERGWSPNNLDVEAGRKELRQIEADPDDFLASLVDREAKGPPIEFPDGSLVPRLPGYRRWMWDGEFCGSIGFRWVEGTAALPEYCVGHAVVPWKRGRGYATQALRETLADARAMGLPHVDLTTQPDNAASQQVIRANGGAFVEEFSTVPALGGQTEWRFRVPLLSKS